MMNKTATLYRAVKTEYRGYKLQFLRTRSYRFLFFRWTRQFWYDVPEEKAHIHGYITLDTMDELANAGYGYCLEDEIWNLQQFIRRYPCIKDYIVWFNNEHCEWLKRQRKDKEKPNTIFLT